MSGCRVMLVSLTDGFNRWQPGGQVQGPGSRSTPGCLRLWATAHDGSASSGCCLKCTCGRELVILACSCQYVLYRPQAYLFLLGRPFHQQCCSRKSCPFPYVRSSYPLPNPFLECCSLYLLITKSCDHPVKGPLSIIRPRLGTLWDPPGAGPNARR